MLVNDSKQHNHDLNPNTELKVELLFHMHMCVYFIKNWSNWIASIDIYSKSFDIMLQKIKTLKSHKYIVSFNFSPFYLPLKYYKFVIYFEVQLMEIHCWCVYFISFHFYNSVFFKFISWNVISLYWVWSY